MISLALASALLASAAGAPSTAQPLRVYSTCVEGLIRTKLGEKLDAAAFEGQLAGACPAEAAAYRSALIQKELSYGTRKADAEKAAADEMTAYLVDMKKLYRTELARAQPPAAAAPVEVAQQAPTGN
ncbi:MAG TPA: hypothetical protein VGW34_04495 [Allosphingosinicella sp.]|nr:hypothetical protein [Allosphingosinicella sp.]